MLSSFRPYDVEKRLDLWGLQIPHTYARPPSGIVKEEVSGSLAALAMIAKIDELIN